MSAVPAGPKRRWILLRSETRQHITAFLGALCLFLSAVEYLIPKPLPFIRLGLANLPLLLGLRFLRPPDLAAVLLLKIMGQGMINGTLASYVFLFSAAGSLTSVLTMSAVHRLGGRRVSLTGVSLAGALSSSVVQTALAVRFVFGDQAKIIAPLIISSGVVSGILIGLFAQRFDSVSVWLRHLEQRYLAADS